MFEESMPKSPPVETTEEIECPECEKQIPLRAEVCPHCELALH
jgi:predicted amidophosphoribosyltransferase